MLFSLAKIPQKFFFAIQTSKDTYSFSNPIELLMDMVNFAIMKMLVLLTNAGSANYLKLDMRCY